MFNKFDLIRLIVFVLGLNYIINAVSEPVPNPKPFDPNSIAMLR